VVLALDTMPVKSDRNDARGIARLLRFGWFRPVHCKSTKAQERRALLTAYELVRAKLRDLKLSLRGILRGFGLKSGKPRRRVLPHGSSNWSLDTHILKRSPKAC
jgi:transposase